MDDSECWQYESVHDVRGLPRLFKCSCSKGIKKGDHLTLQEWYCGPSTPRHLISVLSDPPWPCATSKPLKRVQLSARLSSPVRVVTGHHTIQVAWLMAPVARGKWIIVTSGCLVAWFYVGDTWLVGVTTDGWPSGLITYLSRVGCYELSKWSTDPSPPFESGLIIKDDLNYNPKTNTSIVFVKNLTFTQSLIHNEFLSHTPQLISFIDVFPSLQSHQC